MFSLRSTPDAGPFASTGRPDARLKCLGEGDGGLKKEPLSFLVIKNTLFNRRKVLIKVCKFKPYINTFERLANFYR